MSEYIDNLVKELESEGIKAPESNIVTQTPIIDDRELQVIARVESATGSTFSDEQLAILKHHGSACILACAGSGKTSTSISLIAKRILTGEIKDVNKLIYTTYSKAGATEMKDRLDKLLKSLGLNRVKIEVQTLHAFFLSILRTFGNTSNIVSTSRRSAMVRKACSEAGLSTKDDEAMLVDGLLSYQVNNLLTDKKTVESYVNTLEEMTLEQYSAIRKNYTRYKAEAGVIDYDDMQSFLYLWTVKYGKSSNPNEVALCEQVKDYCKAVYDDFYIDEAQDVSKIQFEIIRALVEDRNNKGKLDKTLVFIGDDDQCLPEGTQIITQYGLRNIEDIQVMDKVLSGVGSGDTSFEVVDNISKKFINDEIVEIHTKSGKTIRATKNHVGFAKIIPNETIFYTYLMYRHDIGFRIGTTSGVRAGNRGELRNGIDVRLMQERSDKIWIIKTSESKEESLYWEAYYAYKYSIPMYRFVVSNGDNSIPKTTLSEQQVIELHRKLDTFSNGIRLLSDLGMSYEFPHRVPQAEGKRCKINHSWFTTKVKNKYGVHNSELGINTSNQDFINTFSDVLRVTDRSTATKYKYANGRKTDSNIDEQIKIIDTIISRCKDNNIYVEVDTNAKFTDNKFMPMTFGNMIVGMLVPTIEEYDTYEGVKYRVVDDEIVSINNVKYNGYVYDLSVPDIRNFSANGMIVHNCIYQWRGSDPSIILSISAKFDIQTFVLNTNYRCHSMILDYASNGIKHNGSRYPKNMNAYNKGGKVEIAPVMHKDLYALSKVAVAHIKYLLNSGYDASEIAVLSRNNVHLVILGNILLKEGIYCSVTNDMKLTKSYIYSQIRDIIDLTEPNWKKDLTSRTLWRLCRFLGVDSSNKIAKFQDDCSLSFEDTLGYIVKTYIDKTINFDKKINITVQASEQMQYIASKFGATTREDLKFIYNALKCDNRADSIKLLLDHYVTYTAKDFLYKSSEDKKRAVDGLVKYLLDLIKQNGVESTINFLKMTEQFENGNMALPGSKVTLTTVHSSKGREWKNVIMFACDNISQPSFDSINKMVHDNISVHDIFSNIDEERRLFYVGNTRAIETLLVITYIEPSIFLLESLGAFGEPSNNNAKVLECAQDKNWDSNYKDFIIKNIYLEESKYYYDFEKHGLYDENKVIRDEYMSKNEEPDETKDETPETKE